MRINLRKIQNPVAMVPCFRRGARPILLHRTIAENRTHPDRCCPKVAKVIELGTDSLQIATMEKAEVRWIESTDPRIGRPRPAVIIGRITIVKSIRQQKINNLALARRSSTRLEKTILSAAEGGED